MSKQSLKREKRNVDFPAGCAGKTSITQKSTDVVMEVEVVTEPLDLTEYNSNVCKEAVDGADILQLTAELSDYDGSKYGKKE